MTDSNQTCSHWIHSLDRRSNAHSRSGALFSVPTTGARFDPVVAVQGTFAAQGPWVLSSDGSRGITHLCSDGSTSYCKVTVSTKPGQGRDGEWIYITAGVDGVDERAQPPALVPIKRRSLVSLVGGAKPVARESNAYVFCTDGSIKMPTGPVGDWTGDESGVPFVIR